MKKCNVAIRIFCVSFEYESQDTNYHCIKSEDLPLLDTHKITITNDCMSSHMSRFDQSYAMKPWMVLLFYHD